MTTYEDEFSIVDQIIKEIGLDIRLAMPLGLGKANHIANAFYLRAQQNPNLNLKIYTALTLSKPIGKSFLEKKFLEPFVERVFGDFVDLQYEIDQRNLCLPANVQIFEFYFPAGKKVNLKSAQENYISCNYTHVSRDLVDVGVNVIAQMVAPSMDGKTFSLSCNPDVTIDIVNELRKRSDQKFICVAQVNRQLPFMHGDAIVSASEFDLVLDNPSYNFKLFGPPKAAVSPRDYMIGFYASCLVKDGGEIQIGIGSLGDALVYALLLRHKNAEIYKSLIEDFGILKSNSEIVSKIGGTGFFKKGLFAASEMLVDGFRHLFDEDVLKRKVFDHIGLQRLLNEDLIDETIDENTIVQLLKSNVISPKITDSDFEFLQKFGIFKDDLTYKPNSIILSNGIEIENDLNVAENFQQVIKNCLGTSLKKGALIHGGFFLGPQDFYQWLRDLPAEKRKLIHMKTVSKINQLYGHEEIDRLHRRDARFINTCLMMTLSGAAVSDGLENGQVISGVGGQYNFVAMAQALPDGHSILQLRSTRESNFKLESNIVFNYGHITIPRHLRDIVITEYGIAYIRGKTDSEVAAALIEIADSRFQGKLIDEAKRAGKLKLDYELPERAKNNYPEKINELLDKYKAKNYFPSFPYGTDFSKEELILAKALKSLKVKSKRKLAMAIMYIRGRFIVPSEDTNKLLSRMGLSEPTTIKEKSYKYLLIAELQSNK